MPYGVVEIGQHLIMLLLIALWPQAITSTNNDYWSMWSSINNLREISQEILYIISFDKILKIDHCSHILHEPIN